jgi:hypothetical protein
MLPAPIAIVEIGASDHRESISPLEGEMSGGTEGVFLRRHC